MQLLEKRRGEEDRPTINYTGSVAKKREKGEEKGKEEEKKREGENFTREEKEEENIGDDLYFDTILER